MSTTKTRTDIKSLISALYTSRTLLVNIFFVAIFVILIVSFYSPRYVIKYIKKHYNLADTNVIVPSGIESYDFVDSNSLSHNYYIRKSKADAPMSRQGVMDVILYVPGGAFISCNPFLPEAIYEILNYDVVSFRYPIRPENTINQSIRWLAECISHIIEQYQKLTKFEHLFFHIVCYSAGAFYASLIINQLNSKYHRHIANMFMICGYYGKESISNKLIFQAFDKLYWSSILNSNNYTVSAVDVTNMDLCVISADGDFLLESTKYFSYLNGLVPIIFKGDHLFLYTSEEGKKAAEYIQKVIQTPQYKLEYS